MDLANRYQAFIFDYGGVLARHQTDEDQARMAEVAGVPKDVFTELYWSQRLDYDKGLLTYREYWDGLGKQAGTTLTASVVDRLVEMDNLSWMQFDAKMWDWADRLRTAGKRIAMLSNMPRELGEALKSRTRKLDCFHHVTLSYEVHSAKPEAMIYEHCLAGLGTAPEESLFLDDRIANVQGAELLGIRAVQFKSHQDLPAAWGA